VNPLSQWLQLMLAEIARKQEDLESARAEELRRAAERAQPIVRGATQTRSARR
jgi:hypothetical protein